MIGKVALLVLYCFVLSGCNSNTSSANEIQQAEYDSALAYSKEFANIYSLDPDNASVLDEGLLAVRLYRTEFSHAPGRPKLQVQLYLDPDVGVNLLEDEGTSINYESFVVSGFEYFPEASTFHANSVEEIAEFGHRVLLYNEEFGIETQMINRYKRTLVEGVTVIEFGAGLRAPFDMFLYVGSQEPGETVQSRAFERLYSGSTSLMEFEFQRFRLPESLHYFLKVSPESE